MFDSIRHKFQSVQENLTASLRGLSAADPAVKKQCVNPNVNFNAGTDILDRFQSSWSDLHGAAQENASRAQEVDHLIGKLHKRLDKRWRDIGQMGTVVARVPEVIHSVNELSNRITVLENLFDTVEKALIQLEDLVETRELQDRELDHRFQLALYKEKKLSMLENFRVTLAEEHAEKVRRHELRQERLMKERQEAFENQFKQDLQIYKETSTVPVVPNVEKIKSKNVKEDALQEVTLEDTEDAGMLDEFLSDEPETVDGS